MKPSRVLFALLFAAIAASMFDIGAGRLTVVVAAPGDVSTFAGGGAGDGGGATNAAVSPFGVAVDGAGNLYIADGANCRIRKVTGSVITTVAGIGVCGYGGDGGPATSARLNFPQGVTLDSAGDLYIADTLNCRVRKVSSGTITTVAGDGICIYGGDGGLATSASLAQPRGVAVNTAGVIYIADTGNCRVRQVAAGTITTLAGTGACGYAGEGVPASGAAISRAQGIGLDATGTLYIADTENCRLRVIVFPSTNIFTVAGGATCGFAGEGTAASGALLDRPRGVTTDVFGDVYLADTDNCRIRKITYPFATISTVAGSASCGYAGDGGPATAAQIRMPYGVAVDSGGGLRIADSDNCRVRAVATGTMTTSAGTGFCAFGGDGGAATNASLSSPGEIALDASGNLYIADPNNCRIRRVTSGGTITTVAGSNACGYGGDGFAATSALLDAPRGVAVDSSGALYIVDTGSCRVRKVQAGIITTIAGNGICAYNGDGILATSASLSFPQSVAVSGTTVYIADTFNCRIRKVVGTTIFTVAGTGACSYSGDGGTASTATLSFPYGVAAGAGDVLYIADTLNCRVRRVLGATINLVAGDGNCEYAGEGVAPPTASLNQPTGVSVDASGNVFIADTDNCRVRLVSAGVIVTVAGTGTGVSFGGCGFAGDGGPAVAAQLNLPQDVALSSTGTMFISDGANRRVRAVAPGADFDGDGDPNVNDNCILTPNGDQLNNDRNFIDLPPVWAFDDLTLPNSDQAGDACDSDDDNDALTDMGEMAGPPCASASAATNPMLADTDGDRRLDGAECALGFNPNSSASAPPAIVSPDADSDGLPDALDPNDATFDADGDGVKDGVEFRNYNTAVQGENTDADACGDGREVASVNADLFVSVGDIALIASALGGVSGDPGYVVNFDTNKDGSIAVGDLVFTAARFGPCP